MANDTLPRELDEALLEVDPSLREAAAALEDASHDAHTFVAQKGKQEIFAIKQSSPLKVAFQLTKKMALSSEPLAKRILKLCYCRLAAGCEKAAVEALKNQLLKAASAAAAQELAEAKQPAQEEVVPGLADDEAASDPSSDSSDEDARGPPLKPEPTEDVAEDHKAWKLLKVSNHKNPYVAFQFDTPEGKVPFQVTVGRAGSARHALRVARLCFQEFERGKSKDEVKELRARLYQELDDAGLTQVTEPVPIVTSEFERPSSQSEQHFAHDVVDGYQSEEVVVEDTPVDSQKNCRAALAADSPLQPELRAKFVFTAQTQRSGRFTQDFHAAAPLQNWQHETNCDLCNLRASRELYLVRCFERRSARPRVMHSALFYAGSECTQALLRQRKLPAGKQLQRELVAMLREPDWESALQRLLQELTQAEARSVLEEVSRLLRGETSSASRERHVSQGQQRRSPLTSAVKPLGVQALDERLRPLGMRVQMASSVWTAVARALKLPNIADFARKAKAAMGVAAADLDQEQQLKQLLGILQCEAEIHELPGSVRTLQPIGEGPFLAKLQLCSVYGRLAGAGSPIKAEQLAAVKQHAAHFFTAEGTETSAPPPAKRPTLRPSTQSAQDPRPKQSAQAAAPEEPGSETDGSEADEALGPPVPVLGPSAVEMQQRADRVMQQLEAVVESIAERPPADVAPLASGSNSSRSVAAAEPAEEEGSSFQRLLTAVRRLQGPRSEDTANSNSLRPTERSARRVAITWQSASTPRSADAPESNSASASSSARRFVTAPVDSQLGSTAGGSSDARGVAYGVDLSDEETDDAAVEKKALPNMLSREHLQRLERALEKGEGPALDDIVHTCAKAVISTAVMGDLKAFVFVKKLQTEHPERASRLDKILQAWRENLRHPNGDKVFIRCPGCSFWKLRKGIKAHLSECKGFMQCGGCKKFVLRKDFDDHISSCTEGCFCRLCAKRFPDHLSYDRHLTECQRRFEELEKAKSLSAEQRRRPGPAIGQARAPPLSPLKQRKEQKKDAAAAKLGPAKPGLLEKPRLKAVQKQNMKKATPKLKPKFKPIKPALQKRAEAEPLEDLTTPKLTPKFKPTKLALHKLALQKRAEAEPLEEVTLRIPRMGRHKLLEDQAKLLKVLQATHNVHIDVSRPMADEDTVLVTVEAESHRATVQQVVAALRTLVRTETVSLPTYAFGAVLGPGGSTVQGLEHSLNVKIKLDKQGQKAVILGSAADVGKAAQKIGGLIRESEASKPLSKTLMLPKFAFGAVMGLRGATVQDLQRTHGVKIRLDKEAETAVISGTPASVHGASQAVQHLITHSTAGTAWTPSEAGRQPGHYALDWTLDAYASQAASGAAQRRQPSHQAPSRKAAKRRR
eukprot:TRINITY_DN105851_c0_g1_i1.p1 TRINITY_DN105851_c0_g1~~TRINITY_DN105851_c0_g1_i1.p1  ORF type:complete len:1371 (-),score=321.34 TRINITY_DN105851_c0_g1_i1:99-4211(-)